MLTPTPRNVTTPRVPARPICSDGTFCCSAWRSETPIWSSCSCPNVEIASACEDYQIAMVHTGLRLFHH